MQKILFKIARTGIISEPAPAADESLRQIAGRLNDEVLKHLGRALAIRHVDAGSCNGCELEIHALNNPYYNLEGLGIKFVASPRHADLLLVTGPVSRNMEGALKPQVAAAGEKAGNLAGAGSNIKPAPKNDPKYGELKWIVEANGAIRGWNEKNAIEISVTPNLQGGKVAWVCRGYPNASMPASCGGRG